ncbi:MAG: FG-GAP-like repeat-containing protein [Burkholderiales bacterium]
MIRSLKTAPRSWGAALACVTALAIGPSPALADEFARSFPDAGVSAIATDASGNTYVAGGFGGTTTTIGSLTLTRIGNFDIFVAKLDAAGDTLWARNFGGSGASASIAPLGALVRDGDGNLLVGGRFDGADLESPALARIGTRDAFLLKLDAAGNLLWARNFGGSGASAAFFGVAVDGSGSVLANGEFSGASLSTPALAKLGLYDAFVVKLDASGSLSWARNFGGSGASTRGGGIAVDVQGNAYTSGIFGDGNLVTPALTRIGVTDVYALKLDASGNVLRASNYGGAGGHLAGGAIALDAFGNTWLAGQIDVNTTTPALVKIGVRDLFAIKLDTAGAVSWAANFGGAGATTSGGRLAIDDNGNALLAGNLNASLTTPPLVAIGTLDALAIRLHPGGGVTFARNFGGAGSQATSFAIASGPGGDILLGGAYYLAGLSTPVLPLVGSSDAFALRVAAAPAVATGAAGAIARDGATLSGTVDDRGFAALAISFDYGPTTVYGATVAGTPASLAAGSGSTAVSAAVTGLACGTTYHFRLKATHAGGTTYGPDASFDTGACAVDPAFPDFNADGKPDLVWSSTASGATYIWRMNGPALLSDSFYALVDPSWKIQGIADFDGDGHPDVVWRNTLNGACFVWYTVDGVFTGTDAFLFALPPEWVIQGVADFNADGRPDFLMRNVVGGNAFAWYFVDATPIGDQFLFSIDPAWKVEAVGDVSADGQPDLLFRSMASGLAFAWNTQYAGGVLSLGASSPMIFSIDPVWEIAQLSDWNADGKPDLLFRNASTGLVFAWYLDGTTLGGSDYVTQIDPGWEIVPRR